MKPFTFVTAAREAALDQREIPSLRRSRMARYKLPELILVVDEFKVIAGANGRNVQRFGPRETAKTSGAPADGEVRE